ncbi:MAG: bifunctional methylenetetrahydrofolate dehydrogenase/methenyltetrahydrofolate cyclohydrolase FolD [Eubacteriales bacterium]|nr:bifunctional methylenetetrahydrofolate dehydrogenase/methenyltetrahydrofolate cyclohydrolase FolD [Eubacteriales bacterium]
MTKILDGKACAANMRSQLQAKIDAQLADGKRRPGLAVILVGEDPASAIYVRNKHRACEKAGIKSMQYLLPSDATESQLIDLIDTLNEDPEIDGMIIQLPLPAGMDVVKIQERVRSDKDVDGFCAEQAGLLFRNRPCLESCTPKGIISLLDANGIEIEGQHAVVVGRSDIVGKPLSILLLNRGATVSICHSKTPDLAAITRQADILCVATGKRHLISAEHIKPGAVVVDVGIHRDDSGKLAGDVNYEDVVDLCSWITPVPGGVGPMTIASLLENTWLAYCDHLGINEA